MSELEDLKKRVAELEKATKAPEPFVPMPMPRRDLTEGMSMDRASMRRMAAVPTLRGYTRICVPFKSTYNDPNHPQQCLRQRQRGSGWVEPRPLESPPGVAIDRSFDGPPR